MTHDIKTDILHKIREGRVRMKPRLYFLALVLGTVLLTVLAVIATLFLCNFVFFSIRLNMTDELLQFGPHAFSTFLYFFPWPLLALDVLFIAVLTKLLRRFKCGYSMSHVTLLAIIFGTALALGLALDELTPFNDAMRDRHDRLPPPFGEMYSQARQSEARGSGVCRCTILEIHGNELVVEDARGATTSLIVHMPPDQIGTSSLKVGDVVFIAGEEKEGIIEAFGVREVRDSHDHVWGARWMRIFLTAMPPLPSRENELSSSSSPFSLSTSSPRHH